MHQEKSGAPPGVRARVTRSPESSIEIQVKMYGQILGETIPGFHNERGHGSGTLLDPDAALPTIARVANFINQFY